MSRKATRAGMSKFNFKTGKIEKRPFNNKACRKRKPNFKYVINQPTMIINEIDENGANIDLKVVKTITRTITRRVFPNSKGEYPEGSFEEEVWHMGNREKGKATSRTHMFITETIEQVVKPTISKVYTN